MSELEFKSAHRRNLPHYQPLGGTFFVTGCLSGSLPKSVLDWYKREKQRFTAQSHALPVSDRAKQELELQRQWFLRIEDALHKAETGPTWLKDDRVAKIVKDAMHFYDEKRYRLDAYCVMRNHFHLVLAPVPITEWDETKALTDNLHDTERDYSLSKIMHSIKSFTSKEANKVLERSGTFWQGESHDRAVRDHQEWERTIAYVINNPVKAGLVAQWEDWPHTYLRPM